MRTCQAMEVVELSDMVYSLPASEMHFKPVCGSILDA
jgi:hypothetical protein